MKGSLKMVPIFPPLVKIFNIFGIRQLQAMLYKNARCLIQWRWIRGQIAFLRDLQKDKECNANATRVENPKKCVLWSTSACWLLFELEVVNIKNRRLLSRVRWEEFDEPKSYSKWKQGLGWSQNLVWSQALKVEQKVVEKGEVGQQSLLEDHEAGNTWRAEEQESRASWKKTVFFLL